MKNKLLALTLAFLMVFATIPAGAIGMMGVETAEEISEVIPTVEEAQVTASSTEFPAGVSAMAVVYEDFTNVENYGESISYAK